MNRILLTVCVISLLLSRCNQVADSESEPQPVAQQPINSNTSTSSDSAPQQDSDGTVFGDKFPEVLAVEVTPSANNRWRFDVTVSSAYDTPQRYADGWRVLDDQGVELGIRVLGHDHASEQPFTRSTTIQIPLGIDVVFVEGRDQKNGWSGQRFEVKLPNEQ